MGSRRKSPGRPPSPDAKTAAERMRSYRARKRAAGLKSVVTWMPAAGDAEPVYSDHSLLDARSLALHALIARKIADDPGLLEVARRNLARWRARDPERAPDYLDEWSRILDKPADRVAGFITSLSPEAVRLRQSSPFAGILTPAERKRIYDAFRA